MNLNSNTHSQRGRWEQGQSPVGGDYHHTIIDPIFKTKIWFFFMLIVGAMAIAPYGCFNVCLFGFDGVVRGLHPTNIDFMPILLNGALGNAPYESQYNTL